jgi:hypothetical protein
MPERNSMKTGLRPGLSYASAFCRLQAIDAATQTAAFLNQGK